MPEIINKNNVKWTLKSIQILYLSAIKVYCYLGSFSSICVRVSTVNMNNNNLILFDFSSLMERLRKSFVTSNQTHWWGIFQR